MIDFRQLEEDQSIHCCSSGLSLLQWIISGRREFGKVLFITSCMFEYLGMGFERW